MNYIAFDTARDFLMAVSDIDGEYNSKQDEGPLQHSVSLMPSIHTLLKGKKLTDVDFIGVNTGPGSFTGIRIGINTAKALSFASNKQLVAYTTFELLAYNIDSPFPPTMAIVSKENDRFYWAVLKMGDLSYLDAPTSMGAEDLQGFIDAREGWDSITGIDGLDIKIPEGVKVYRQYKKATRSLCKLIESKIRNKVFATTDSLVPTYVQVSQAERLRIEAEKARKEKEKEELARQEYEATLRRMEEEERRRNAIKPEFITPEVLASTEEINIADKPRVAKEAAGAHIKNAKNCRTKIERSAIHKLKRDAVARLAPDGYDAENYNAVMDTEMTDLLRIYIEERKEKEIAEVFEAMASDGGTRVIKPIKQEAPAKQQTKQQAAHEKTEPVIVLEPEPVIAMEPAFEPAIILDAPPPDPEPIIIAPEPVIALGADTAGQPEFKPAAGKPEATDSAVKEDDLSDLINSMLNDNSASANTNNSEEINFDDIDFSKLFG